MPKKLTEAFCESLTCDGRDRIVFDAAQPGFGVRITAAGRKLYIARARVGGSQRYLALGELGTIKLADARKEARRALEALRDGRDPMLERRERQRVAAAGAVTVDDLAKRWLSEIVMPKRKPRTASDYQRLIDQRIGPEFGHLAVGAVEREHVIRWHAQMANTPRRANYAVQVFKILMNFAEDVGLRVPHTNPCRRIEFYREKKRERFLSEAEIGKAAEAIATAERSGKIGAHAAAGLRLCLFTGARSGEITAAKWAHVDFERRFIRLPDSKTNEPRTIHLSDAALEIIKTLPRVGPYIIAGAKAGQPFQNLKRSWTVARKFAGLDDVRLHDLRHSYASLAAGRGISLQMIGKLLGHKTPQTTQRYAHLARDAAAGVNDELGAAMTAAIEGRASSAPETDNVVSLRKSRRRARTRATAS